MPAQSSTEASASATRRVMRATVMRATVVVLLAFAALCVIRPHIPSGE